MYLLISCKSFPAGQQVAVLVRYITFAGYWIVLHLLTISRKMLPALFFIPQGWQESGEKEVPLL